MSVRAVLAVIIASWYHHTHSQYMYSQDMWGGRICVHQCFHRNTTGSDLLNLTLRYKCSGHGFCLPERGDVYDKFYCFCEPGYAPYHVTGNRDCQHDIDECRERHSVCGNDPLAQCVDGTKMNPRLNGSFICKCNASGYVFYQDEKNREGFHCSDVDECVDLGGNPCLKQPETICINTVGDYECKKCPDGQKPDAAGLMCEDDDECYNRSRPTDVCRGECENVLGSYFCYCGSGYSVAADNKSCHNIDECKTRCQQKNMECEDTEGSYKCSCRSGYKMLENVVTCVDVDECNEELDSNKWCINTLASFVCMPGYRLVQLTDSGEKVCSDVSECKGEGHGCQQTCVDTEGSYVCSCNQGYELSTENYKTCDDVNECQTRCSSTGAICENNSGSFSCSCKPGFSYAEAEADCTDTNECELQQNPCAAPAQCYNTIGTYECRCYEGWTLDGGSKCADINECDAGNHQCKDNEYCKNVFGSYTCLCNAGFNLVVANNGYRCVDIDECKFSRYCDLDRTRATCTNTEGSYTCRCLDGYINSPHNYCSDKDECEENGDACGDHGETCKNFIGGYTCVCQHGWTGGRCENDVDECQIKCQVGACNNTNGSFYCTCADGLVYDEELSDCQDENECTGRPDACGWGRCLNLVGSFMCQCYDVELTEWQNSTVPCGEIRCQTQEQCPECPVCCEVCSSCPTTSSCPVCPTCEPCPTCKSSTNCNETLTTPTHWLKHYVTYPNDGGSASLGLLTHGGIIIMLAAVINCVMRSPVLV